MHVLSFLYLVNINPKARTMEDFLGLSFKTIKKYFWNVVSEISKQAIFDLIDKKNLNYLVVDTTYIYIQRPNYLVQEFYWNKHYTGGHGIKYLTFVTPSGLIAGVFGYLPGSEDDLSILKNVLYFKTTHQLHSLEIKNLKQPNSTTFTLQSKEKETT